MIRLAQQRMPRTDNTTHYAIPHLNERPSPQHETCRATTLAPHGLYPQLLDR